MRVTIVEGRLQGFRLGDALAGDVEGAARGAGGDRNRQAAEQGHAAVETHQLHRDLALVVVHRDHRVVVAAPRRHENGVGGERAARVDAGGAHFFHRRSDDLDLFRAHGAAVAGVRVQAGDRDARLVHPGGALVVMDDADRCAHLVDADLAGDVLERNVRGDARGPQLAGDIEFGGGAGHIEQVGVIAQLVLVGQPGQAHRALVERREQDTVDVAGLDRAARQFQAGKHGLAGSGRHLADFDLTGGDARVRHKGGAPGRAMRAFDGLGPGRVQRDARGLFTQGQHRRVGHDDALGALQVGRARQQLDRQLGADAAGVAEEDADAGSARHWMESAYRD